MDSEFASDIFGPEFAASRPLSRDEQERILQEERKRSVVRSSIHHDAHEYQHPDPSSLGSMQTLNSPSFVFARYATTLKTIFSPETREMILKTSPNQMYRKCLEDCSSQSAGPSVDQIHVALPLNHKSATLSGVVVISTPATLGNSPSSLRHAVVESLKEGVSFIRIPLEISNQSMVALAAIMKSAHIQVFAITMEEYTNQYDISFQPTCIVQHKSDGVERYLKLSSSMGHGTVLLPRKTKQKPVDPRMFWFEQHDCRMAAFNQLGLYTEVDQLCDTYIQHVFRNPATSKIMARVKTSVCTEGEGPATNMLDYILQRAMTTDKTFKSEIHKEANVKRMSGKARNDTLIQCLKSKWSNLSPSEIEDIASVLITEVGEEKIKDQRTYLWELPEQVIRSTVETYFKSMGVLDSTFSIADTLELQLQPIGMDIGKLGEILHEQFRSGEEERQHSDLSCEIRIGFRFVVEKNPSSSEGRSELMEVEDDVPDIPDLAKRVTDDQKDVYPSFVKSSPSDMGDEVVSSRVTRSRRKIGGDSDDENRQLKSPPQKTKGKKKYVSVSSDDDNGNERGRGGGGKSSRYSDEEQSSVRRASKKSMGGGGGGKKRSEDVKVERPPPRRRVVSPDSDEEQNKSKKRDVVRRGRVVSDEEEGGGEGESKIDLEESDVTQRISKMKASSSPTSKRRSNQGRNIDDGNGESRSSSSRIAKGRKYAGRGMQSDIEFSGDE